MSHSGLITFGSRALTFRHYLHPPTTTTTTTTSPPPPSPPHSPSKAAVIRSGRRWKPFTATLPLLSPPHCCSRGCWSAGSPPAGDLLHLRRVGEGGVGVGGWDGGGVSDVTHDLEVKDTGDRRGPAQQTPSSSLLASCQAHLAVENKAAWCVCGAWSSCTRPAQVRMCSVARLHVLLPADDETVRRQPHNIPR